MRLRLLFIPMGLLRGRCRAILWGFDAMSAAAVSYAAGRSLMPPAGRYSLWVGRPTAIIRIA